MAHAYNQRIIISKSSLTTQRIQATQATQDPIKRKKKKHTQSVVRLYLLKWKLWGGAWQPAETNPLGNPDTQQIRESMSVFSVVSL